jgi:hypothetical protein
MKACSTEKTKGVAEEHLASALEVWKVSIQSHILFQLIR